MLQAGEPYVYAGDDPVNEWDPKGLLPKYVGANGAVEAPAGIIRALDWGASWPTGDLEDAIEQAFQVGSRSGELVVASPGQGQGKIIFSGSETDVEVVYDSEGDYYRVLKLQENGQIMALNSEGSFIPDTPQYYSETYFNNTGQYLHRSTRRPTGSTPHLESRQAVLTQREATTTTLAMTSAVVAAVGLVGLGKSLVPGNVYSATKRHLRAACC